MNLLKTIILGSSFLISSHSFSANTQSPELNELSGVECDIFNKNGDWGNVSFSNGAYIDNAGHYLWVNFASDEELNIKIYKRKSIISSLGGLINDEVILDHTHNLDDLITYSDREKLFEVAFDTKESVDIDYSRPRDIFDKNIGGQFTLSCFYTRGQSGDFTILLNNKIASSHEWNNRQNNKYESLDLDASWDIYYKARDYENRPLKANKYE